MVHTFVQLVGFWKLTYIFKVADLSPKNIFGNKPPQMVPMHLNIGETRAWRLDSGPNLQPWDTLWPWGICWDASPTPDANHQQDYNFLGSGIQKKKLHFPLLRGGVFSIPGYISNHLLSETHVFFLPPSPKKNIAAVYRCFLFLYFFPYRHS